MNIMNTHIMMIARAIQTDVYSEGDCRPCWISRISYSHDSDSASILCRFRSQFETRFWWSKIDRIIKSSLESLRQFWLILQKRFCSRFCTRVRWTRFRIDAELPAELCVRIKVGHGNIDSGRFCSPESTPESTLESSSIHLSWLYSRGLWTRNPEPDVGR